MKLIELSRKRKGKYKGKYFAQVDDEDFNWLNHFLWNPKVIGNNVYASTMAHPRQLMHKLIAIKHGILEDGKEIDHEDRNGLNCQKYNLRAATHAQNIQNQRMPKNKHGFTGVDIHRGKYRAQIRVNGKRKHVGYYPTAKDAGHAYIEAAKIHYGEFANNLVKEFNAKHN